MMKKIFFVIFILLFSRIAFSQQGYLSGNSPHDSLIFDGGISNQQLFGNSCTCKIKIIKQSGICRGTTCEKKIEDVCGENDTFDVNVKGIIPSYAKELSDGDTISTGDFEDCFLHLSLYDGKEITLGRGASIIINKEHCKNPMSLKVFDGNIYLDLTKGDREKSISVKTIRGEVINRGTKYSIETVHEGDKTYDLVKVYEGSVEVKLNKFDESGIKNNADALKKLYDDYKNGKISKEEYTEKMKEYSTALQKESSDIKVSQVVDAGYQCTMGDKLGDVVPIDSDDSGWFEKIK